jgi:hypothetical protein
MTYEELLAKVRAIQNERRALGLCVMCGDTQHEWFWCPEQIEQRISFAYGNVAMENPLVTREIVEHICWDNVHRLRRGES